MDESAVEFLRAYGETFGFTSGRPTSITMTPDGSTVFFLRSDARSFTRDLYALDIATGRESRLASAEYLLDGRAEHISAEERASNERQRRVASGIASYELSRDGDRLLVPLSGRLFVIDRSENRVVELSSDAGYARDARLSPDGRRVSCVRGGELYVIDVASGVEQQLTKASAPTVTNGSPDYVAQEELQRDEGCWWSPDGRVLIYQQTDTSAVAEISLGDPMHPAATPHALRFPYSGSNNPDVRLGILPSAGGETTWIQWDRAQYPYVARVVWTEGNPCTLLVQSRDQTELMLLSVDVDSGITRVLLLESDPAWVNVDITVPRWLEDGSGFLWSSERSGVWKLELRAHDGAFVRALTDETVGYEGLLGFDNGARVAYVLGAASDASRQLWSVPLDTTPRRISFERGVHGAVFAESGGLRVRVFAGLSGTRSYIVEAQDGRALAELTSKAEDPRLELNAEWTVIGSSRCRALVLRPRDFVTGRPYPVIVSFYGGNYAAAERRATAVFLPTSLANSVVPVSGMYLLDQWLADRGFIVVNIEGRGMPGRGRAWERDIHARLGDVLVADQLEGLKALADRIPEMDMRRVGIFGWSLGGYVGCLALLRHPDIFHAAIVGAPVTEWRDYTTHYTERYFGGRPEERTDIYNRASLLTYAKDLVRPLLLVHGTADDNVTFSHSIKLSNELFRAGKHHDFLPLAGLSHMVPDPVVTVCLQERILAFFLAHLVEKLPTPVVPT